MLRLIFSPLLIVSAVAAATVQLGDTTLTGKDIPYDGTSGLEFYGGIPFAEAPIGSLRFKPPVPKASLGVLTFDASSFGPSCLQVKIPTFAEIPLPPSLSEDCLSLSILRPAGIPANASLPVMVYISGGGFIIDALPQLDASPVVARSISRALGQGTPIVFAMMNYRLGPLGFPSGSEATAKGALNLGLRDQLAALEWIQSNIAAFGGDKDKVTLLGISGGAISIGNFYLTNTIEKYARGAIMQSGVAGSSSVFTGPRGQKNWDNFVAAIPECASSGKNNSFDCLQRDDINSTHLLQAITTSLSLTEEQLPWLPTIDGPDGLIPELPSEFYKKGNFPSVPFIAGNALDEGTVFTPHPIQLDEGALRTALVANLTTFSPDREHELEDAVDKLLGLYPDDPALGSPFNTGDQLFNLTSQYKRWAAINGDMLFQSTRRAFTQAATKAGVKAYGFLFTYGELTAALQPVDGVRHGADVPYGWGFSNLPGFVPSASSAKLSQQIVDYWISFVTTLDPNDGLGSETFIHRDGAGPAWPSYEPENQTLLELNGPNTTTITDDYRAEQIDFLNQNGLLFRH
ncbi:hypothetical protein V5O48_014846 [Marasmius crinis-equi]|uniref:Carboxylic ester hydrolase n=1 Tax=Marasmius crinis-equi TaxID=585013 RepID=A0ABR3EW64_9AGAR